MAMRTAETPTIAPVTVYAASRVVSTSMAEYSATREFEPTARV